MKLPRTTTAAAALVVALFGATIAAMVAHAGSSGAKTITVKETEYHLALSPKTASPGAAVFVVHNAGRYPHAFAVAGPGVAAKRTKIIKPGATAKLAATLRSGRYSLWCPVPGHAAKGMKASLRVGGSAPATTTAPATSTSGGGAWG